MKTFTHSIRLLALLLIAFCLSAGVQYLSAWTGATDEPPEGNVEPPVNVSLTNQIKDGGLGVGTLAVYGQSIFQGNIDLSGYEVTNVGTPTGTSSAATKAYVDSVVGGGSGSGDGVMYLRSKGSTPSTSCPSGWDEAAYQDSYAVGEGSVYSNNVRTCYAESACRVMYLESKGSVTSTTCPSGWDEAAYQDVYAVGEGSIYSNNIRTCYVCE